MEKSWKFLENVRTKCVLANRARGTHCCDYWNCRQKASEEGCIELGYVLYSTIYIGTKQEGKWEREKEEEWSRTREVVQCIVERRRFSGLAFPPLGLQQALDPLVSFGLSRLLSSAVLKPRKLQTHGTIMGEGASEMAKPPNVETASSLSFSFSLPVYIHPMEKPRCTAVPRQSRGWRATVRTKSPRPNAHQKPKLSHAILSPYSTLFFLSHIFFFFQHNHAKMFMFTFSPS